jgi:hypothetical protein
VTTVRTLLFGKSGDQITAADRLAASGLISGHPEAPQAMIGREILARVAEALEFEVSAVLVDAWRVRSALLVAARETHASPGLVRQVALMTYEIPWQHQLELDVRVAGHTLTSVTVDVGLLLEVTALSVTIQNGLLTGVGEGSYRVEAGLTILSLPLLTRERVFDLAHELKVGKGIRLFPETAKLSP